MGRPSWHYDHPPACTCVSCAENRSRPPRSIISSVTNFMSRYLRNIFRK